MSEECIEMLKEMIEQSVNPVGWLGYNEGFLVSFLQTQEQLDSFLKNTEPTGKVIPVYTHPIRKLTDEQIDANRYQWLRNEFANGRETYLAEGIPNGEQLDKYIDEQLKKASDEK